MARRGFGGTALRAALGAVTGVAEGLQQREILAAQRKQQEEANALARFGALRSAGFGFAPVRTSADAAAREAFALETPELPAPTMGGSAMGTALAKAMQGGLGVSSRPTGMLETPISLALDTSKTRQFERGAAMQPANAAERVKLGGMEFGVVSPEVQAQNEMDREMAKYQKQLEAQEGIRATTEARKTATAEQQATRLANLYTKTYADAQGRPLSQDMALAAAMQGKTPLEMGFVEKPMSPQERVRLNLDMQRLNLSEREYALKSREQDRRESDSQRRREAMPSGAQRRLEGLDGGVLLVGDVREMLKATPGAVGPVKGRMLGSVVDAMDKQGVGARASIEAMSGEIRNQRFGGALSVNEAKFAERFLPDAKDSYETAMTKLDQLEKFLETKRKGVFMTYQQPYRAIYTEGAPAASGGAANPYR